VRSSLRAAELGRSVRLTSTNVPSIRDLAIIAVFVALFVTLSIASPVFLSKANLLNILDQNVAIGVAALGATLVVIAGGLDLSTGAIFGLAGVISAYAAQKVGAELSWVAGLLTGVVAGAINGFLVVGLRVNSLLITLGTSLAVASLATVLTNGIPKAVEDPGFAVLGQNQFLGLSIGIWLLIVAALMTSYVLRRSVLGRHIFAIGGNAEAARLSGVPVGRVIVLVFVLAGLAAGFAGMFTASRIAQGSPTAGTNLLFPVLTAVFLGGTSVYGGEGAVWRTIVGLFILALMNNGFNLLNLPVLYQPMIQGTLIVAAVGLDAWTERRKSGPATLRL
jgi:ribose transport system permease protein